MSHWMSTDGPEHDICLSSRVRLARNLPDLPFPERLHPPMAQEITRRVKSALERSRFNPMNFLQMSSITPLERQMLVERHIASPALCENHSMGALLFNVDETLAIMVHEEDHLRIQCMRPGFDLPGAAGGVFELENAIAAGVPLAFDQQLGYLTCCPTNTGTGMRASVMMHLPGLKKTGYVDTILQLVGKIGIAVRGIYGEGSDAMGDIYQISNQVTLGLTERSLLENLINTCSQIIERERTARNLILEHGGMEFQDRVWRAYGLLLHARRMDSREFMRLLSDVKLGADLRMLPIQRPLRLLDLMQQVQSATLQKQAGTELATDERDALRAELVRRTLTELN